MVRLDKEITEKDLQRYRTYFEADYIRQIQESSMSDTEKLDELQRIRNIYRKR